MLSALVFRRAFAANNIKVGEAKIRNLLIQHFPQAKVKVVDISGGCGAMFEIFIEGNEFQGLSVLKQHKLVTNVLKEEVKEMHGLRINTSVPK